MALPGLSFAAPSTAISGFTTGPDTTGNVNTGSQFSFGASSWPFGGSALSPFSGNTAVPPFAAGGVPYGAQGPNWQSIGVVLIVAAVALHFIKHKKVF